MFCNQCGAQLIEGAKFCRVCGRAVSAAASSAEVPTSEFPAQFTDQPANSAAAYAPTVQQPTEPKALGSLISGIIGLTFIPVLASIVAVVLGHMSLSEIKKSAGRLKGQGMAIAGLVMGYLGIAFIPIILIIAAIAIPNLLRARIGANESSAIGAVRSINYAEQKYSAQAPDKGFTCSLSDLGPRFGVGASDDAADLIDAGIASGTKFGYNFSLRNCESDTTGGPVVRYKLLAEPVNSGVTGGKIFCSDETGEIRSARGSTDDCLRNGTAIER